MAKTKAQKKTTAVSVRETVPSDKATMVVTVYDGTRQPIQGRHFLIRMFDGFQKQLRDDDRPAPTTLFTLPAQDRVWKFTTNSSGVGRARTQKKT